MRKEQKEEGRRERRRKLRKKEGRTKGRKDMWNAKRVNEEKRGQRKRSFTTK